MANIFTSALGKNIGTSASTLVTVAALTQTTVIGLTVSNTSAGLINVDVYITRGGVDYYIVKAADVPIGGAIVPIGGDQKVVLIASDALKVRSSVAASADAVLSVLNIT